MARWNYYQKKLVGTDELETLLDGLDPDKPEIETILEINRAIDYALTQSLASSVLQEYRDIRIMLECLVNEWIDDTREEIRRQYDVNDHQNIELFDEWSEFIRQLPENFLDNDAEADEYIEALAGQIHLGSDYRPQHEDDYGEEAEV